MKKLLFLLLFIPTLCYASPPSRTYTYTTGEVIAADKVTQNEDNIFNYLTAGVDTYADDTITNSDINSSAAISYSKLSLGSSILTGDIKDGEIVNADISSSAAITDSKLAQITTAGKVSSTAITGGLTLPSGAVFFMITGSCPTGSTDVTATYSDKFIKINATQGTSSGTVLTGTSDSHTLTATEMPSHTHTFPEWGTASGSNPRIVAASDNNGSSSNTGSAGSGGGHTHTLSAATTLEPSSITCKMCQVN